MNRRLKIVLAGAGLVAVVFLALWLLGQSSQQQTSAVIAPKVAAESRSVLEREMSLYFASPDRTHLVSTPVRIGCSGEIDCLQKVGEALLAGPGGDAREVLPERARLLGVQVSDDLATFDFDTLLVEAHPGGSQNELLSVYALANSVAVNFSHLRQVQITVEGKTVATLKGHVDLRGPLLADFTYSRRPTTGGVDKDE